MFKYLRDQWATVQLKARYQRLVHERLLELTEESAQRPVSEDPGDWQLVGTAKGQLSTQGQSSVRDRARRLVRQNPHASNLLRLLEAYVTGPGLQLNHHTVIAATAAGDSELLQRADQLWQAFLASNCRHYSFREHARRTWRDGECFVRKFPSDSWPPAVRFVDPEQIAPSTEAPHSQGIVCDPQDAELPLYYLVVPQQSGSQGAERIPAEVMLQTRIGVDSNEKRGISVFAPVLDSLDCYEKWLETELLARKLQSSVVLWRKVQGSPQMAESVADQAGQSGSGREARRERFAPGTILTTNHGTDIQFLQPNTNFGDAVSLGRMLLLSVAAGAGLPEFMLTADASNANFASTMIAEGPAVKYFQSEQQFFAHEFTRLWRSIMGDAVELGLLPDDFFSRVTTSWTFPPLVNRDRPRERMADVRLIEAGVLSRAEVSRREGVDPAAMRVEQQAEMPEGRSRD
ncbi:phage portal protein [Planctomicrobium sp. SH664]|uniref:phage portal protein n=1 Tax=Planctomicrobium sp. SH664 TaxID=3448125 RepID=UPI003F5AFD1F